MRAVGFNLAASVVRDQTRLVGVVLGGDTAMDHDKTMADLFDRAFMRLHILRPPPAPPPLVEVAELAPPAAALAPAPVPAPRPQSIGVPAQPVAEAAPSPPDWSVKVGAYQGYDGAQRRLQEATLALPLGFLHARPEIRARP